MIDDKNTQKDIPKHKFEIQQPSLYSHIVGPALAAIPYAGGPLSQIWSNWDGNRRFQRIEHVLNKLCNSLGQKHSIFDPTKLDEADMQLLEMTLQRVQTEHREKKRIMFAAMMESLWIEQHNLQFEERIKFIRALDEFDEIHIQILKFLNITTIEEFPNYECLAKKVLGNKLDNEERDAILLPALDRLATGYGFIKRAWGMSDQKGNILISKNLSVEGIARKCEHVITNPGKRFLEAIKSENEQ